MRTTVKISTGPTPQNQRDVYVSSHPAILDAVVEALETAGDDLEGPEYSSHSTALNRLREATGLGAAEEDDE